MIEQEDKGSISDGYHTFDELYEHRNLLFCLLLSEGEGWKSLLHDDGTAYDGWFVAGTTLSSGPITYHLPLAMWNVCPAKVLDKAPPFDGHTSNHVLRRLRQHLTIKPPHITGGYKQVMTHEERQQFWATSELGKKLFPNINWDVCKRGNKE